MDFTQDVNCQYIAFHSGQQDPASKRVLAPNTDGKIRGYLLIDNVNNFTKKFPYDAGYFVAGGNGIAMNNNALWGNFRIVDPANNFSGGDNLVHIEAANGLNPPNNYSFYGRYIEGSKADEREPLLREFVFPYGIRSGDTRVLFWRDSKLNSGAAGSGPPPWAEGGGGTPMAYSLYFWDMDGTGWSPTLPSQNPLNLECGSVSMNDLTSDPINQGTVLLNLDHQATPFGGTEAQALVLILQNSEGQYQSMARPVATNGIMFDSTTKANGGKQ